VNVPVVLGRVRRQIARAGRDVKGFREGDRVVSETAAVICGACAYCRSGEYNLCPIRMVLDMAWMAQWQEYVRVPARCLHRLPSAVSFERAALTEPCCVAYNAAVVQTRIRPGDTVAVIGPGPIGLLCLQMAKLCSPGKLAMLGVEADATPGRRDSLGADAAIAGDAMTWIRRNGDGLGADVVIDAAGVSHR